MSTLREKLDEALGQLAGLRAREADRLESSGLREQLEALTAENQRLSDRRGQAALALDEARRHLDDARQQRALLELQLKGARARVAKLSQAVGGRR